MEHNKKKQKEGIITRTKDTEIKQFQDRKDMVSEREIRKAKTIKEKTRDRTGKYEKKKERNIEQ